MEKVYIYHCYTYSGFWLELYSMQIVVTCRSHPRSSKKIRPFSFLCNIWIKFCHIRTFVPFQMTYFPTNTAYDLCTCSTVILWKSFLSFYMLVPVATACVSPAIMQVIECADGNHNIVIGRKFWYQGTWMRGWRQLKYLHENKYPEIWHKSVL